MQLSTKRLIVVDDTPADIEALHAQNQAAIAMILAPREGRHTEEQIRERLALLLPEIIRQAGAL
jgi:beta-phosphoglucomutase-like phosphatase (HAD superfamily)